MKRAATAIQKAARTAGSFEDVVHEVDGDDRQRYAVPEEPCEFESYGFSDLRHRYTRAAKPLLVYHLREEQDHMEIPVAKMWDNHRS